jgi:hypothetical protein
MKYSSYRSNQSIELEEDLYPFVKTNIDEDIDLNSLLNIQSDLHLGVIDTLFMYDKDGIQQSNLRRISSTWKYVDHKFMVCFNLIIFYLQRNLHY